MKKNLATFLCAFTIVSFILILVFISQTVTCHKLAQSVEGKVMRYSEFIVALKNQKVESVILQGDIVTGKLTDGTRFFTYRPNDPHLIDDLVNKQIAIEVQPESMINPQWFLAIFISIWLPVLFQTIILVYFIKRWLSVRR
jgi:ATP-dependent Zn protease